MREGENMNKLDNPVAMRTWEIVQPWTAGTL